MDIERLKELKAEFEQVRKYNDRHYMSTVTEDDVIEVLDEAIARQSVKSEEVQGAIVVVNEKIYGHREYIKLANNSSKVINLKPEYDKIDALELAITALQAYQPWVSVSERLPEREEHYLCCEMNYQAIFVAYYGTSGWQRPLYRETTVTHWKPLPEPPKGE